MPNEPTEGDAGETDAQRMEPPPPHVVGLPPHTTASRWEAAPCDGPDRHFFACESGTPALAQTCHNGWCSVPPGTFWMGTPETSAAWEKGDVYFEVTITRPVVMQQTEMPIPLIEELLDKEFPEQHLCKPSAHAPCPATDVSGADMIRAANALSIRHGLPRCYSEVGTLAAGFDHPAECPGYRLPTEAEWEHAARAGTVTDHYAGDMSPDQVQSKIDPKLDAIAWYWINSGDQLHPVGLKQPNAWGLHDMFGNAGEPIWDVWNADPSAHPAVDPAGPNPSLKDATSHRVCRSCRFHQVGRFCRAGYRYKCGAGSWEGWDISDIGFRLARTLQPAP